MMLALLTVKVLPKTETKRHRDRQAQPDCVTAKDYLAALHPYKTMEGMNMNWISNLESIVKEYREEKNFGLLDCIEF